jgi:hypothetical protein
VPEVFANMLVFALKEYTHTHPLVMKERIANVDWTFEYDERKNKLSFKEHFKNFTEKLFGVRFFDYKNYNKI